MTVTISSDPVLVAAGSHWLELEATSRREQEPFKHEEVYPILELDVPRVGKVRAKFQVSRYVASDATLGPVWTGWNVILREVMLPDEERPDLPHLGREAQGIGPATRDAIREACEPIVRGWLDTHAYRESRREAAAYAFCRAVDAPPSYRLDDARRTLARISEHLDEDQAARFQVGLNKLGEAIKLLES